MPRPLDRRSALRLGGLLAGGVLVSATGMVQGCTATAETATTEKKESEHGSGGSEAMTAEEALDRLRFGNRRFAGGNAIHPDEGAKRRKELTSAQHPIATVLSCVDSRVPPELIFDEGLGGLFVIRTAGQTVDHAVLGSIQFGVHELHIPLLVVLGHSGCGAVKATIEAVEKHSAPSGTYIDALIAAIKPAVELAKEDRPADLVDATVRANVRIGVKSLSLAAVLAPTIAEHKLTVIGARYDLDSGKVEFFKG
jgi:carbonic anhydrase